ncbi:MAG TPA: hypothetical protein PKO41_10590, partial [Dokdonella sp.]|nr:hypothetical protein [Dokdonella sp.]
PAGYAPAQLEALILERDLDEISGLTASRRTPDLFWVHNDAPRPATLVALDGKGRRRGSLRIDGVRAVDWEDIAGYALDGKAWLLVADSGDNGVVRGDYELIAIEEPALAGDGSEQVVKPAWRLRFRYADGARDVEAMAVDLDTREVLLLGKHAPDPLLFTLPLGPGDGAIAIARRRLALTSIPAPNTSERNARFPAARLGGSPTAMDIDASGRNALVMTYRDLWFYARDEGETWIQAFARRPLRLPLPPLAQAEAAGFEYPGTAVRVSGERLPAPWIRFEKAGMEHRE